MPPIMNTIPIDDQYEIEIQSKNCKISISATNDSNNPDYNRRQHRRRNSTTTTTSKISGNNHRQKPTSLGPNFQPGKYDCICGRGKVAYNHVGNKWLRTLIDTYKHSYEQASDSKIQRSIIVTKILHIVRTHGTGFVKQERNSSGEWIEVGDMLGKFAYLLLLQVIRR